jgi:hypothetical protein
LSNKIKTSTNFLVYFVLILAVYEREHKLKILNIIQPRKYQKRNITSINKNEHTLKLHFLCIRRQTCHHRGYRHQNLLN